MHLKFSMAFLTAAKFHSFVKDCRKNSGISFNLLQTLNYFEDHIQHVCKCSAIYVHAYRIDM